MSFLKLQRKIQNQFDYIVKNSSQLFVVNLEGDDLFEKYLSGFDEEYRQEHTCNACKRFVKNYGKIVGIIDNEIVTIWDIGIKGREEWGIVTDTFHEVSSVMYSPNYWGDNKVGNKHLFFYN